jgi:hypothetical protein
MADVVVGDDDQVVPGGAQTGQAADHLAVRPGALGLDDQGVGRPGVDVLLPEHVVRPVHDGDVAPGGQGAQVCGQLTDFVVMSRTSTVPAQGDDHLERERHDDMEGSRGQRGPPSETS